MKLRRKFWVEESLGDGHPTGSLRVSEWLNMRND